MERTILRLASLSLLTLFLMSYTASACIGLIAGKINFNVTAGTSETLPMQVFNACNNQTIYFNATARFGVITNVTTPKVTVSPADGTMGPSAPQFINITVSMPYNATPNTTWTGGVVVVEVSNLSAGGGASVQTGVIKRITAVAKAAPVNYLLYGAAGVAVIAIAGGGAYYFKFLRKGKKPARKAQAKRAARKRTAGRKAKGKRKTSRRRRR